MLFTADTEPGLWFAFFLILAQTNANFFDYLILKKIEISNSFFALSVKTIKTVNLHIHNNQLPFV